MQLKQNGLLKIIVPTAIAIAVFIGIKAYIWMPAGGIPP